MRKTIAAIMLASLTIAIVSFIHTISPQASSALYAQKVIRKISIPVYNLATNGTLADILSNNLVNYLNESATIIN